MNEKLKSAVMSLVIVTALYFAVKLLYTKALSSKMYPNFGIRIPNGYTVHGIDVSRYQKDINWELVKKMQDQGVKLQFAFLKCTEGIGYKDATYSFNKKEAENNNLLCGAYHYFSARENGKSQAKFFIRNANLSGNNLAPVVDIEETKGMTKAKIQQELQACLDALEDEYKCKPIIYCNVDFYDAHLGEAFDKYPLWAAHYYVSKPNIKRNWQIWQHSDKGNVNGIDAKVDFNVVNGTSLQLNSLKIN